MCRLLLALFDVHLFELDLLVEVVVPELPFLVETPPICILQEPALQITFGLVEKVRLFDKSR